MKNIVVLVSGGGTNLQALIDAQGRGELKNGKITTSQIILYAVRVLIEPPMLTPSYLTRISALPSGTIFERRIIGVLPIASRTFE